MNAEFQKEFDRLRAHRNHAHETDDQLRHRVELRIALRSRKESGAASNQVEVDESKSIDVSKPDSPEVPKVSTVPVFVPGPPVIPYLRWIIALLVVLIALMGKQAFGQVDSVVVLQNGVKVGNNCAAGICSLNFSGCTVTNKAHLWTITCNAGDITNNPGGNTNYVQYNNNGSFGGIDPGAEAGKVLITQPSGPPLFADPLVQGTQDAGSTTLPKPVGVGGSDYAGTPALRAVKVGSDGTLYVNLPQYTPSSGRLPVDGSGVTQPVSAASLPLPTGASTAAKQPALGTAGVASSDVITVQGVASMTPLAASQADGANVTLGAKADARSTATDTTAITAMQVLKQISYMLQNPASQAVTGTFWQATQPVSGTVTANNPTAANLKVEAVFPSAQAVTATLGAETTKVIGTVNLAANQALAANQSVNVAQVNGVTPLMGAGNTGTGSPRVTIASDQAITPSSIGTTATTTDSALGCYLQSAASTNATNCKGSAGNFYGVRAVNTTTTIYYLRLYNTASSPTCSSATGFIETIPIPPASAAGGAGGIASVTSIAIGYSTGISFCLTGGGASTDNTNAATGVYLTLYYK